MSLDTFLFKSMYSLSHRLWLLDWLMIFLAEYSGYVLVLLAFILFVLLRKDWRKQAYYFAVISLSLLLSSGIATPVIKYFYFRPRPFAVLGLRALIAESGSAFPSAHASFFFALAASVLFFNKKLGTWFLAIATLMGIARIYVGVHYPLDILGGAAIGILSVLFVVYILESGKFRERLRTLTF